MKLRQTTFKDIPEIITIINEGKAYLKDQGIDQWQNGYPNESVIEKDILAEEAYVLEEDGNIVGTAMISFAGEKSYETIEGKWLSSLPYAVLHRVAIPNALKGRGLAGILLEKAEELCRKRGVQALRIDTHEKNKSMQQLLNKSGFTYCGVIYLDIHAPGDKGSRLAYEKLLSR